MNKKNEIHEGVCRYCGQVQQVEAATQEEADEVATEKCDCDEAKRYRHRLEFFQLIDDACARVPADGGFVAMTDAQIEALHTIGEMMASGTISKAAIDIADSRCIMSTKKEDGLTFKRSRTLQLGGGCIVRHGN